MSAGPSSNGSKNDGPNIRLGFMVAGSEMASFTIFGLLLDYILGTMPGFTVGLTFLGLVVAFLHLKQMANKLTARKPKPPTNTGGSGT